MLTAKLTPTDVNVLAKIVDGQTGTYLGKYMFLQSKIPLILTSILEKDKIKEDYFKLNNQDIVELAEQLHKVLDKGEYSQRHLEYVICDALRTMGKADFFEEEKVTMEELNIIRKKHNKVMNIT